MPPDTFRRPRVATLVPSREPVVISDRTYVARRAVRKRIPLEQAQHFRRSFEKPFAKGATQGVGPVIARGGEPNLPVQARLIGRGPARRAGHISGFVREFVRPPSL